MTKWINVKDSLPPDCEDIVVFVPGFGITGAYLMYDFDGLPIRYVIIDFHNYEETLSLKEVTHWMILPHPIEVSIPLNEDCIDPPAHEIEVDYIELKLTPEQVKQFYSYKIIGET